MDERGVGPHPPRHPHGPRVLVVQARDPTPHRRRWRLDHQLLVGRGGGGLSRPCGLRRRQGRDELAQPIDRDGVLARRHPLQHHHRRPDHHQQQGRRPAPRRHSSRTVPGSRATSPTPHSGSPPTSRRSSPAARSPSMVARRWWAATTRSPRPPPRDSVPTRCRRGANRVRDVSVREPRGRRAARHDVDP